MKALLFPLLEQAIVNGFLSKAPPFARKNKFGLSLIALSGLFLVIGIIFAILAGYGWLLTEFTQPLAALIVAGSVVVLGLFFALLGYLKLKQRPSVPAMDVPSDQITEIATLLGEVVEEELAEPIKQHPKTALLLASVAGFVAADRFQ